jgi:hypothetical protein
MKNIDKKNATVKPKDIQKNKTKAIILGIVIIIIIVAIVGFYMNKKEDASGDISYIDGIGCGTMEYSVFHIHAHLDIIINGQQHPIPAQIGILDNTCLYWLHTHDQSGIIHIEAPIHTKFTLGQFLDVWNSTKNIMLHYGTPKVYVNGNVVAGNYRDVELAAHEEIVLSYGIPPISIPSSYEFPPGL